MTKTELKNKISEFMKKKFGDSIKNSTDLSTVVDDDKVDSTVNALMKEMKMDSSATQVTIEKGTTIDTLATQLMDEMKNMDADDKDDSKEDAKDDDMMTEAAKKDDDDKEEDDDDMQEMSDDDKEEEDDDAKEEDEEDENKAKKKKDVKEQIDNLFAQDETDNTEGNIQTPNNGMVNPVFTYVGQRIVEMQEEFNKLDMDIKQGKDSFEALKFNGIKSAENYHSIVAAIAIVLLLLNY